MLALNVRVLILLHKVIGYFLCPMLWLWSVLVFVFPFCGQAKTGPKRGLIGPKKVVGCRGSGSLCPPSRWSGAGGGVCMLRVAGDFQMFKFTICFFNLDNFQFGNFQFGKFQFGNVQFGNFQFGSFQFGHFQFGCFNLQMSKISN